MNKKIETIRIVLKLSPTILLLLLSGCVGVGRPIPTHDPFKDPQNDDSLEALYSDPYKFARGRIVQWSTAVDHLQIGNTAATSALLPLAAIIGYRTARSKSSAATAGLATGGMIGLSLSDALIQINRLDAYLRGIDAMECAIAYYPREFIPSEFPDNYWSEFRTLPPELRHFLSSMNTDIVTRSLPLTSKVRAEMILAIRRITTEVNQALRGSIVSVHDLSRTTLPIASFDPPVDPKTEKTDIEIFLSDLRAGAAEIEKSTSDSPIVVMGKELEVEKADLDSAIEIALGLKSTQQSVEYLEQIQDERIKKIRACSVVKGLNAVASDRMASEPVELEVVPRSDDGKEQLKGCEGDDVTYAIAGGIPPYRAQLSPSSAGLGVSVQDSQVTITVVEESTGEEEQFAIDIWDRDNRHSSLSFTLLEGDECG